MNAVRLKVLLTILANGNYTVDVEKGEVYSNKRRKWGPLGSINIKNGYVKLCLRHHGTNYHYHLHEVIVVAAGLNLENLTVNHKSGVKTDNRLKNLEVMSHCDNVKHARDTGLIGRKKKRARRTKKKKTA